jgi:hypothetical protein
VSIESRQAFTRGNVNRSILCFEKIVDVAIGQPIGGRKICKTVAVKTRNSSGRTEPQKTPRVLFDFEHSVLQQTVGNGIGSDWETFAANCRGPKREEEQGNQPQASRFVNQTWWHRGLSGYRTFMPDVRRDQAVTLND